MKILVILPVYNEMYWLPRKVKWCEENGFDVYCVDNFSTDGTWEWMKENGIKGHRVDTQGAFYLPTLHAEMVKAVHQIRPDWVIKNGADLFFLHDFFRGEIVQADVQGYNAIETDYVMFHNTGRWPPYFCNGIHKLTYIHKYTSDFKYFADEIQFPNKKVKYIEALCVNIGNAKSLENRQETLKRRQKAWDMGEPEGHGVHYRDGEKHSWKWNKEELLDIRKTKYGGLYETFVGEFL